ncbi:MAG: hypothetical protein QM723_18370 [Myxococcaceae bacterium]
MNTSAAAVAIPPSTIPTWPLIVAYLAARAPVPITTDSAMRWAKRKVDPLPVHRWGPRNRPRVYAIPAELDAWLKRQNHNGGES